MKIRIVFKPSVHFNLLYMILFNQSLYIIPGSPGNRMMHVIDSPKILLEVKRTSTIEEWERFFLFSLSDSKKLKHLPKKQRFEIAKASIEKMKDIAMLRKKNA